MPVPLFLFILASPFGQQTALKLNADGYVESMDNPNQEKTSFTYKTGGLLETLTGPRNFAKTFSYGPLGEFLREDDAFGGFKTLTRTGPDENLDVAFETRLGLV